MGMRGNIRRDKKHRVLRAGESIRADGKYQLRMGRNNAFYAGTAIQSVPGDKRRKTVLASCNFNGRSFPPYGCTGHEVALCIFKAEQYGNWPGSGKDM